MTIFKVGRLFLNFLLKRDLQTYAKTRKLMLGGRFAGFVNVDKSAELEKRHRDDPNHVFEYKFFQTRDTDQNDFANVGNYHLELTIKDDYGTVEGKDQIRLLLWKDSLRTSLK